MLIKYVYFCKIMNWPIYGFQNLINSQIILVLLMLPNHFYIQLSVLSFKTVTWTVAQNIQQRIFQRNI